MKVSIITVCYNSALTIADSIKSVLMQDYKNIEYVIIDGASKDMTVKIAESYSEEFKAKGISYKIYSEPDNGIYDAMNKGISKSNGEVIGILNSDDCYVSCDIITTVVKSMNEEYDTCYGNLMYVKNEKPYRFWKSGVYKTFKFGWMPPHPAFFVKKRIYSKYGMFRLDCGVNADYEIMLRFLEKNKVSTRWVNKTFVYMKAGGTSGNGIKSRIQGIEDNKIAWLVNDMKPAFYTIPLKKTRKISQYLVAGFVKVGDRT